MTAKKQSFLLQKLKTPLIFAFIGSLTVED